MFLQHFQYMECNLVFNSRQFHYIPYITLHIDLKVFVISFILQGFMEDEGRQRTTKYISHKCVSLNEISFFILTSHFTDHHYTKYRSTHVT